MVKADSRPRSPGLPDSRGPPDLMAAEQAQPISGSDGSGLSPAFAAVRVRLGLVLALFALAAIGWWWMSARCRGWTMGPWTSLGTFGWFLGVWVVMMAAMMFPSIAPTVALYSRMTKPGFRCRRWRSRLAISLTWAAAGRRWPGQSLSVVSRLGRGDVLAWDDAGRALAGATVLVAAVYELTPLKDVCLGQVPQPPRFPAGLLARRVARRRCGWARRTAPGAWAVAGRSWRHCSRWAS